MGQIPPLASVEAITERTSIVVSKLKWVSFVNANIFRHNLYVVNYLEV